MTRYDLNPHYSQSLSAYRDPATPPPPSTQASHHPPRAIPGCGTISPSHPSYLIIEK